MVIPPRSLLLTHAYPDTEDVEGVPVVVVVAVSGSISYFPRLVETCWLVPMSAEPVDVRRFSHLPVQDPTVELPR